MQADREYFSFTAGICLGKSNLSFVSSVSERVPVVSKIKEFDSSAQMISME